MLQEDIRNGKYSIGELIVPQTFSHLVFKDGALQHENITVAGRKQPLHMIRKKLLEKHSIYTRSKSDEDYAVMTREQIVEELTKIHEYDPLIDENESTSTLLCKLKKFQRTRHLAFWHDGSTLSNHGHLLMMVNCIYDHALYYTDKEIKEKTGQSIDVQAQVESPEVY